MKKIFLLVLVVFFTLCSALCFYDAKAMNGYEACEDAYGNIDPGLCDRGSEAAIKTAVANALNAIYGIVAILAVVFVIIGGIKYTISQGNPSSIQSAKSTIVAAIIGLVISLSAFAITQFILGALAGN